MGKQKQGKGTEKLKRLLLKLFLWLTNKEYEEFKKKVIEIGYNPKDIWYSRKTGFICMPPDDPAGFGPMTGKPISTRDWRYIMASNCPTK